jgi:sensor histidine kinase YesM
MLQLDVHDDGSGLPLTDGEREPLQKSGVGLANTRARLAHLYGTAHRFELENQPGRGLTVTMAIPFRETGTENSSENPGADS